MKMNFRGLNGLFGLLLVALLVCNVQTATATDKIKALILDGQNAPYHNWRVTTPILRAALESSGRFTVDVATTPPAGSNMEIFKPDFSKYGVVIINYHGVDWSDATRKDFENYMTNGGGMVSVHSADNAFPGWLEYNKMLGVGGWDGRTQAVGPMIRWRDGKQVSEVGGPGNRGTHGSYFSWAVETRNPDHPIMQGLPAKWMHTPDELYSMLAGPAENVTVLATGKSDVTSENEPILMTINYGKGRVFHTTMGHDAQSLKDVGFVTTFNRGAEWAATGQVTIPIPADFPTADKTSVWNPPAK
jgi:type 1 glutamine amidotransferase